MGRRSSASITHRTKNAQSGSNRSADSDSSMRRRYTRWSWRAAGLGSYGNTNANPRTPSACSGIASSGSRSSTRRAYERAFSRSCSWVSAGSSHGGGSSLTRVDPSRTGSGSRPP
ncbi:hypothetical protein [Kutzneria kofuensis]|uniref:hypothetical protein n=1 Tax=Kutzneria kofuensis TaxID=103725 RepID=UPI0031EFF3A5